MAGRSAVTGGAPSNSWPRPLPHRWGRSTVGLLVVLGAGLVLGGLTSYGQTLLPDEVNSFANSPSGWTALTALLVWRNRDPALLINAMSGVVGFAALTLGYQMVSTARGFFFTGEVWFVVAAVAGPFVGLAASWLHRRDVLGALGIALLASIGLGDARLGLLLSTTSPVYWWIIGLGALVLLTVVCVRRLASATARVTAVIGATAFTGLYIVAAPAVFSIVFS